MSSTHRPATADGGSRSRRWAPWWLYLVVLVPANQLRAALLPADDVPAPALVAIAVAQAVLLLAVVTVVWRAAHRPGG